MFLFQNFKITLRENKSIVSKSVQIKQQLENIINPQIEESQKKEANKKWQLESKKQKRQRYVQIYLIWPINISILCSFIKSPLVSNWTKNVLLITKQIEEFISKKLKNKQVSIYSENKNQKKVILAI